VLTCGWCLDRMFIPVGPDGGEQDVWTVDKDAHGKVTKKRLFGVRVREPFSFRASSLSLEPSSCRCSPLGTSSVPYRGLRAHKRAAMFGEETSAPTAGILRHEAPPRPPSSVHSRDHFVSPLIIPTRNAQC
jgi:hypothetical protein